MIPLGSRSWGTVVQCNITYDDNLLTSANTYTYNEQTNAHLIDSLLYYSLYIAPAYFNNNTSSSGSTHSVPAKLRKRVHALLVVLFKHEHIYVT